jgi:putative endonuclease
MQAEDAACAALVRDGFSILARRLRTKAGEIDIVASREGLLVFGEVKCRPDLLRAAYALGLRQQGRLRAAAEIALADHPDWGGGDVRFDVLLVDRAGVVRRIADAFREQ